VTDEVDWPCRVERNFSEVNLGCGVRPATGLSWVFSQVDKAIVLEDDCLPADSFFRYCEELLVRYEHDPRIVHIGGSNFISKKRTPTASYAFSRNNQCWGWATWRRAWNNYDYAIKTWPAMRETGQLRTFVSNQMEYEFWQSAFDHIHRGVRDIWDFQWVYAGWMQGGLAIYPEQNLIMNLGFRPDATHTFDRENFYQSALDEIGPLIHPEKIEADPAFDQAVFEFGHGGRIYRAQRSRNASWKRKAGKWLSRHWRQICKICQPQGS
jgi:hypothetical protein